MSEENTNETTDEPEPEPTKSELHERVEQLESTVEKLMPSRRDALKLGAAGLAGAAGLGAASQSADASTGSAGTIGSNSDRPDLLADQVDTNRATVQAPSRPIDIEHIARDTDASKTTFDFSLPGDFSRYLIDYSIADSGTTGDVRLRFANDSSGNALYAFFDESGTKTTGADSITLFTIASAFYEGDGQIWVNENEKRPSINHQMGAGRVGNISTFAQTGGRDSRDSPLSSVQILTPSVAVIDINIFGVVQR